MNIKKMLYAQKELDDIWMKKAKTGLLEEKQN